MSGSTSAPDARAPSYNDVVKYGGLTIPYEVVRSERTTLGIHVYPSGDVEVRAPNGAEAAEVRTRVQRRARWIVRHRRHFAETVREQPQSEYVNGETHRYLGRQYRLKLLPSDPSEGDTEGVRLVGRYFEVRTSRPGDPARTRALLERWYRAKATVRLRERFDRGCELMARYGVARPPLVVRRMERRWGSCTASGRVLLNPRLVLAPTACIDYVVVHELCHLSHPNHGREFYGLLGRVMPDWAERKARLEAVQ